MTKYAELRRSYTNAKTKVKEAILMQEIADSEPVDKSEFIREAATTAKEVKDSPEQEIVVMEQFIETLHATLTAQEVAHHRVKLDDIFESVKIKMQAVIEK